MLQITKRAVSDVVSQIPGTSRQVISHKDGDPRNLVTETDPWAEGFLATRYREEFPDHAFFGEETHKVGATIDPETPTHIVDPLDGTTNWSQEIPICCTSSGLWHRNEPVLGVIADVNHGTIWETIAGEFARSNGQPIQANLTEFVAEAIIAFDLPRGSEYRREVLLGLNILMRQARGTRQFGSAVYALAAVASGLVDAYVNFELWDWDFAAGLPLVQTAGGVVTKVNGGMVRLTSGTPTTIIAACTKNLHREIANALHYPK